MKAFKNRLEEMAEATVNALDYSDSKVEYPDISIVQKWPIIITSRKRNSRRIL